MCPNLIHFNKNVLQEQQKPNSVVVAAGEEKEEFARRVKEVVIVEVEPAIKNQYYCHQLVRPETELNLGPDFVQEQLLLLKLSLSVNSYT